MPTASPDTTQTDGVFSGTIRKSRTLHAALRREISKVNMKERFSLKNSFDLIFAIFTAVSVIAVLYTFVIGRHYIIPSAILAGAVLFGNIAKYGFQDQPWAKQILFWSGFLFTGHAFFALFFAKIYRLWLGDAFEIICGIVVVVFGYLLFEYARRNQILNS